MKHSIGVFLVLSLLVVQQSDAQAAAPQTASTQVAISGWRLECNSSSTALACRVLDQISQPSNGALILSLSLNQNADGKTMMALQVPLGAAVGTPVVVSIPSGPSQSVPFLTCSQVGCFATAELNTALLSSMQSAQGDLHVTYSILDNSLSAHEISAAMPLGGFPQAFAKLKK